GADVGAAVAGEVDLAELLAAALLDLETQKRIDGVGEGAAVGAAAVEAVVGVAAELAGTGKPLEDLGALVVEADDGLATLAPVERATASRRDDFLKDLARRIETALQ